jgi:hypothetical protein
MTVVDKGDALCPTCDAHLEAEFEDRTNGGIDPVVMEDGRVTDPDLEAWFAARATDPEEQRWAIADVRMGEW